MYSINNSIRGLAIISIFMLWLFWNAKFTVSGSQVDLDRGPCGGKIEEHARKAEKIMKKHHISWVVAKKNKINKSYSITVRGHCLEPGDCIEFELIGAWWTHGNKPLAILGLNSKEITWHEKLWKNIPIEAPSFSTAGWRIHEGKCEGGFLGPLWPKNSYAATHIHSNGWADSGESLLFGTILDALEVISPKERKEKILSESSEWLGEPRTVILQSAFFHRKKYEIHLMSNHSKKAHLE